MSPWNNLFHGNDFDDRFLGEKSAMGMHVVVNEGELQELRKWYEQRLALRRLSCRAWETAKLGSVIAVAVQFIVALICRFWL